MPLKTDMGYLFSTETVKKIELDFANNNFGGLDTLMERAGAAVFKETQKLLAGKGGKTVVLAGSGNNGGDGYVVARLLKEKGFDVSVCAYKEPKTELCIAKRGLFDGEVFTYRKGIFEDADLLIDAVFGTGFKGELDEYTKQVFSAFNSSKAQKVAVDVPSGAYADSEKVAQNCIKADITVTFIGFKNCQLFFPASEFCGKTVLSELKIGNLSDYENQGVVTDNIKFEKRLKNTHKGTYGTVALVVGSYGMAGAAILSARACLKSGIGIAKLIIPEDIYSVVTCAVPEAVCLPVPRFEEKVAKDLSAADCVLVGCGLSKSSDAEILLKSAIKNANKTIIIDADGLNLLSDSIDLIEGLKAELILTPHPGEMSRLVGVSVKEIEANRVFYAKQLAKKLSCVVVLKGAVTVIADKNGEVHFNILGNAGMATGGSGDALAGIMAAFCAAGKTAVRAAVESVYIHSLAGDLAKENKGEISLLPSDIIELLPEAFKISGE